MILTVVRRWLTEDAVLGELHVNGRFRCFTLEDLPPEPGLVKVPGKTAIPRGIYPLAFDYSPRFKMVLPRVLNVPNFEGVRIHAGNFAEDTEGCILVGLDRFRNHVERSRLALHQLLSYFDDALAAKEPMMLTVLQVND